MENSNDLHLLYKKLGETPNQCILRFKKDNPNFEKVTMTYAGRLDPMAEGLLLVLSGENIKQKEKFLHMSKVYEFKILWGVSTDTFDVLGLITSTNNTVPEKELVFECIKNSVGKINQLYPPFSSKPVSGKPLFKWTREGRLNQIEIPRHDVSLMNAEFVSRKSISKDVLEEEIKEKISLISGDFRQKEILKDWLSFFQKNSISVFTIDTIKVEVSSGFYVRQFVTDLSKQLGVSAITYHIKRTQVGEFKIY